MNEVSTEISNKVSNKASNKVSNKVSNNELSNDLLNELSNELLNEIELSKELSKELSNDLSKELSKISTDYNELERLRKNIESLNSSHHVEIAKIFMNNNIKLTENDNGIFINLNNIKNIIIVEIKAYLDFIKNQESYINKDEIFKEELENIYFKDNKANLSNNNEEELINVSSQ